MPGARSVAGVTAHDPSPLTAQAPGVRITACPRGAHLMTWTTHGVERLWMSPLSGCGQPAALRGGIPVLFPQFAAFGPLVKHGFARTTPWRAVPSDEVPDRAVLAFELHDSADTRAVWAHPFRARLDVSASPRDLVVRLSVTNLDEYPARFTGGLHTYLRVTGPGARITGLGGASGWDGVSTQDPQFTVPVADCLAALDERDLVMHDVAGPITLHDDELGTLVLRAEGLPDRVVWNPGPDHGLPDVLPGGAAEFVCIEPTAVTPQVIAAGRTWVGTQVLEVVD